MRDAEVAGVALSHFIKPELILLRLAATLAILATRISGRIRIEVWRS